MTNPSRSEQKQQKVSEKKWIVYDHRANYDEYEAMVLVACSSLQEARGYLKQFESYEPVIFEYDVVDKTLINGRIVK